MTSPMSLDFRNVNALWASVVAETLVRSGVSRVVVSPGSRSTPLTLALARHPSIEATPVLDERSAAFFALGIAKASGRPVLLLCTSGTAAANYFPAIVEAHESAVPLLVITADRPPEMRASASGQTIDQLKLYGSYVRFFHELALPELDANRLRYLRQTVLHACERTVGPDAGPVHLNAPFRDPLPPVPDNGGAATFGRSINWTNFFAQVGTPAAVAGELARAANAPGAGPTLTPEAHGLIVVGPNQPVDGEDFASAVGALAKRLGWPVLADGLTPLRHYGSRVPSLITTYDAILRNPTAAERLKPDVVVCVGEWPTSKVLRSWLELQDAPIWMANSRADNRDALHGRARRFGHGLGQLAPHASASAPGGYAGMWSRYDEQARGAIDRRFAETVDVVEPKVVPLLATMLPAGTPVVVANSMPIRDVEYFWPANDRGTRVVCNRGANGIDGTLSTALGVADATRRPTVLLTGDLALLHDTNGFLAAAKIRGSLTIVLINNRGGGIFEHLPVAAFDGFEEYFATPQQVDFGRLAAAYGASHVQVPDLEALAGELANLPANGVRVLEIRTDRKRDAAWRRQLFADVAAGLM